MRQPEYSTQFRRDMKLAKKRGKNMEKLKKLMQLLIDSQSLPAVYLDHPLKGDRGGCRDLHIEPNWLLIYRADEKTVRFERPGTHSDLFD